jgi:hypothetical protein
VKIISDSSSLIPESDLSRERTETTIIINCGYIIERIYNPDLKSYPCKQFKIYKYEFLLAILIFFGYSSSVEQLNQHLFLTENKRFSQGMENGLTFLDLKEIRIILREIAIEQQIRKSNFFRRLYTNTYIICLF